MEKWIVQWYERIHETAQYILHTEFPDCTKMRLLPTRQQPHENLN